MKRILTPLVLLLSSFNVYSASDKVDFVNECFMYMSVYDIVTDATGMVATDQDPVHRGLVAAVLSLANQLEQRTDMEDHEILANVKEVVESVVNSTGGTGCTEDY